MAGKGAKKWVLFGCLGLVGIVVVVVGSVFGVAALAVRSEETVDQLRTHELPVAPGSASAAAAADPASAHTGGGTLIIDMGGGEFYLEPGEPGEPLNVEAMYDHRFYELQETIEGDEHWTYDLRFRLTRNPILTGIKEMIGGSQPRVRLRVPPDIPIALRLKSRNGTADVEVGGLWLTTADFEVEQAFLILDADAPLHQPVDSISVRGGRGGVYLKSMHHLSPRELDFDFVWGGVQIDLRGQWRADATVRLSGGMSDTVLRLPRRALILGLETTRPPFVASPETPAPTLTIELEEGTRGKIRVFE